MLTIIVPVYNEKKTIRAILKKVSNLKNLRKQIIIVDDGSTDGTTEILKNEYFNKKKKYKVIFHKINQGKGAAIKSAQKFIKQKYVAIQDADLEYNPEDYDNLIKPFLNANADVVYGSRFLGGQYVKLSFFWHYVANKALTTFCNIFTNLNMTDMETGYKLFKSEAIKSIELNEKSFGIEPEITIKLSKKKYIFYEVPISYSGRSYHEGKKIGLKDAFKAIYCIIRYRFFD